MAEVEFETRYSRTVNLPDIFRTPGGLNFDLGPLDRLRDAQSNGERDNITWSRKGQENKDSETQGCCPRIILRDPLGRELDTFTTLQEAIYRAKWNVRQTGQSREPLEWRLPKAPVPARPDLTRTCPPARPRPLVYDRSMRTNRNVPGHIMEFDVEDVGFVRESLQRMPYVPTLSFLRQEILVGPKTYFQIVGTMLLHRKVLSQTEKRQAIYNFPGFCSGCLRMGLCYGCERSSQMHYHADKLMKTGGGFTYFKKDKPENEIKSKNPSNWKITDPNRTLKRLMEEYAGVDLEGPISDEVKKQLDRNSNQSGTILPQIPDYAKGFEEYDTEQEASRQAENEAVHSDHGEGDIDLDDDGFEDDLNLVARYNSQDEGIMEGEEFIGDRGQGETDASDLDFEMAGDMASGDKESNRGRDTEQPHLAVPTAGYAHAVTPDFGVRQDLHGPHDSKRHDGYVGFEHRLPKYRKRGPEEEASDEEDDEYGDKTFGPRAIGTRGRTKERLYIAPPPFKPKKSPSRITEAKSPFSTNRKLNVPKGKVFEVKKSDKPLTEIVEFKGSDVSWKAPKKFELKQTESKTTKFWSGPPPSKKKEKKIERKARSLSPPKTKKVTAPPRSVSPDSGVESGFKTDSTKSGLEPVREDTFTPTPPSSAFKPVKMEEPTTPKPEKLQRREIIKKEKKVEVKRPKPRTPTPPPPKTPSPVEEKPPSRELSFVFVRDREPSVPKLPELPPIEIPALPEIKSPEPEAKQEKAKPQKMLIEVTPELKDAPKKLRPPPKLAPRIKPFVHMRRGKAAEAPVTTEELQEATDPLDFLAKYCIINPDRLPYYDRVFSSALSVQTPRYNREIEMHSHGTRVRLPPAQLSSHEMHMLRDLTVLSRVESVRKQGLTTPEQYLEKLNYSVEFIQKKQDDIADKMAKMQAAKTHYMAELAKSWKPDIARLSYKSKIKSKKRDETKSKKRKPKLPDYDTFGAMSSPPKDFQPRTLDDITDDVIVSRMDDKMRKKAKKDPKVQRWNLELKRDIERLKNFDQRLNQIDDEKDLVSLYCMDYFYSEQMASSRPQEFKRQQSALYQSLNPDPDTEMNIEEVEAALQQINNRLMTEKEFQYIYFVLNLPRRQKINFRLFCIIAALSEKVSQMDPFVRKLMNKVDYNALDVKMEKSKELFSLLQDSDSLPPANALASDLSVELTAGGLTPEHTNYVLSKFNREGRGFVDFLDFVTYVPLFIEIHKRIIEDPFNDTLEI